MANQPNIFEFATSELSQDASICWLVSYVNHPEEEKLNECAKDFIALLYSLGKDESEKIDGNAVAALVGKPKQQYCHTDVYFQAVIDKRRASFIIEDKTFTSYHSNQLNRYKECIENDNIKEDEVVCIYFKVGYLLPRDYKVQEYGYHILNYEKWHEFLQSHKTNNLIFESYKEYIKENFYDYYEDNKNRWQKDDYECFRYYFAQLEFMKKLLEQCKQNIDPDEIGDHRLYNGKNRDGTAWTQMWFIKLKSVYGKDSDESVFYRLDKRKNPEGGEKPEYYLSIRQYAQVKDNPVAKQKKLERLRKYIKILGEINMSTSLDFSNIHKDNSGANESEIGTLFFDKGKHKPTVVLEQIGGIHEQFVKRIQRTDIIMKS